MVLQRRIYVGNLFNDPEGCLKELGVRFAKFGRCSGEFETRGSFAYINMEFEEDSQFAKLKSCFNHVKFRGNELRVEEAKQPWKWDEQKRKDDEEEPIRRKQMMVRHWKYYKKIENINMNLYDRMQVIPGRNRKTRRSKHQLRNMTFRINVKGSLKVYKCFKQKLWGYERNIEVRDLVHKFASGHWLNGWDHIVEGAKGLSRTDKGEEDDDCNEKERTGKVLEDMLKSFDFDRPMVDDDEEIVLERPNEEEQDKEKDDYDEEIILERPNGEELDKQKDDDSIPKFDKDNSTDVLRLLFDPQENRSFKLIPDSDDDIDHNKDVDQEVFVEDLDLPRMESFPVERKSAPLFFPHFDTPFLSGQTQLSKLSISQPDWQSWQTQFWDQRIDWIKEMKRKRKDALKQLARKKFKNNVHILV